MTGLLLAPLRWYLQQGALSGFPWGSALTYFPGNALLLIAQPDIGGTLEGAATSIWNGSIWTLVYEFACYLAVAGLALIGMFKRPWIVTAAFGVVAVLSLTGTVPGGNQSIGTLNAGQLISFFLFFAAGMLLALYEKHLRLTAWLALPSLAFSAALLYAWERSVPLVVIPLAYFLLWLGAVLPAGPLRRTDISYGVYIYGYPIQQVLAATALVDHGVLLADVSAVLITFLAGWLSWVCVERRALLLKDWSPRFRGSKPTTAPANS